MAILKRLELAGYKSIHSAGVDFEMLNVLIGANGSGKSNLVSFFRFVGAMIDGRMQEYIARAGGARAFLYYGAPEDTPLSSKIILEDDTGVYEHAMQLAPVLDALIFVKESISFTPCRPETRTSTEQGPWHLELGSGHQESALATQSISHPAAQAIERILRAGQYYQFHDTSATAAIKHGAPMDDCERLQANGANLASLLYAMQHENRPYYERIVETIREVFPHFQDFVLQPEENRIVRLNWREDDPEPSRGRPGHIFTPYQLSDGTLRFMALACLMLQPEGLLPPILLIDEPELGLHPFAIQILGSMIDNASRRSQIILATQSVDLVDFFDPAKIIVTERPERDTIYRRLDPAQYAEWLQTYTLGDLWKKNVIGGRPSR